ncbi:MAG: fibronectin type III domain-containing protein, partial [Chitinivibrionales bacterium]|nr:fibronectin type III domain-containing protein [Chitinivibrionales bacterium]
KRDGLTDLELTPGEKISLRLVLDYYDDLFDPSACIRFTLKPANGIIYDAAEYGNAQWSITHSGNSNKPVLDAKECVFGYSSIKAFLPAATPATFRYTLTTPMNLSGYTSLTFALKNDHPLYEKHVDGNLYVRLYTTMGNYYELIESNTINKLNVLNESRKAWRVFRFPFTGDERWKINSIGGGDITAVEIGFTTGQFEATYWVDGISVTKTPQPLLPSFPSSNPPIVSNITSTSCVVTWDAASGGSGENIVYKVRLDDKVVPVITTSDLTCTITGLESNKYYTVVVNATVSSGESDPIRENFFTLAPTPPWKVNVLYQIGDKVMYGGKEWVNTYEHTSISTWYPGALGVWFWQEE